MTRDDVSRLFTLRRELTRFERILGPTAEVCSKLVNFDLPCLDIEARPYFGDVLDHVRRMENRVGGLRDVLTFVFEASTLLEQQRQGAITRQLAAWAAILAVPTAIAGIYGMNFEYMPELKTRYGYFVVVGIIALLCSVLFFHFKRARWL
jgi:magnesium transporter